MKYFFALSIGRMKIILALLICSPWVCLAQESLPYLVGTGTQLELVGFPVHSPALDSGPVTSVAGTIVSWTPSFRDRPFGSALPQGQECYAEVVGPLGHPWLGQRFELDETATRARTDHGLVTTPSPYNTRGIPNGSLIGAQLEVRPHLSVEGLFGQTVRNRLVYGKQAPASFIFSVPAFPSTRDVNPFLLNKSLAWHLLNRPGALVPGPLLIPPGGALGIAFGNVRGTPLGLTGSARNWPTSAPLFVGVNLLSYPYPRDLRLGLDWGSAREGFGGQTKPFSGQDRLELIYGHRRISYAPENQTDGKLRWRRLHPRFVDDQWAVPASYLDTIPVGQGFILRKNKADPNHVFYPPKP